jgi:hypothetical protein
MEKIFIQFLTEKIQIQNINIYFELNCRLYPQKHKFEHTFVIFEQYNYRIVTH